jgi:hypothetical protein
MKFILLFWILAQTVTPVEPLPIAYVNAIYVAPTLVTTGFYIAAGGETTPLPPHLIMSICFCPTTVSPGQHGHRIVQSWLSPDHQTQTLTWALQRKRM